MIHKSASYSQVVVGDLSIVRERLSKVDPLKTLGNLL